MSGPATDADGHHSHLSIGELLGDLSGYGIYSVGITGEFRPFGFTYEPMTDLLTYEGRSERLFARTPSQIQESLDRDPAGGILAEDLPPQCRMVDAVSISSAVHRLLLPGQPLPSDTYQDRGKRYRLNVAAIRAVDAAFKAGIRPN